LFSLVKKYLSLEGCLDSIMSKPNSEKDASFAIARSTDNHLEHGSGRFRFPISYHGKQNPRPATPAVPCGCKIRSVEEKSLYCGPHSEPVAAVTLPDDEEFFFPYDKILNCPCYQAYNGKLEEPVKTPLFRPAITRENHNCRTCCWCRNTRYLTGKYQEEERKQQVDKTPPPTSTTEVVSSALAKTKRPSLVLMHFSQVVKEKGLQSPEAHRLLNELIVQAEDRSDEKIRSSEESRFIEDATCDDGSVEQDKLFSMPEAKKPPDIGSSLQTFEQVGEETEHANSISVLNENIPPDKQVWNPYSVITGDGSTQDNPDLLTEENLNAVAYVRGLDHYRPPDIHSNTHVSVSRGTQFSLPGHKRTQTYRARQGRRKHGKRGVVLSGEGVALY
jgi:hypothetical protein